MSGSVGRFRGSPGKAYGYDGSERKHIDGVAGETVALERYRSGTTHTRHFDADGGEHNGRFSGVVGHGPRRADR